MTTLEKIDFVFFYLKEKNQIGGKWGYNNIWNHIEQSPETNINKTMFNEIIKRLKDDGYIVEKIEKDVQPIYNLTFDGTLFEGYKKESNDSNKHTNEIRKLSRLTLFLTIIISIGTGIAAIYYLLEILNHWFSIYPKK